jgi:N-acetylornithine carbamoyltransferase
MFADGKDLATDIADAKFAQMAALAGKPVINLESAVNHPCQALADWKTLEDLKVPHRARFVLSWVQHPRALPLAVPAATAHMAALRGMELIILRPDEFALPGPIMARVRAAAEQSGGSVHESNDRAAALDGAQVLYAKEWGCTQPYGDAAADMAARQRYPDWCVRPEWFAHTAPDCRLMHCLPVRRNVAISDAVLDGPHSVVLHQAHNRLTAQMAVLYSLLKS